MFHQLLTISVGIATGLQRARSVIAALLHRGEAARQNLEAALQAGETNQALSMWYVVQSDSTWQLDAQRVACCSDCRAQLTEDLGDAVAEPEA